MRRAGEVVSKSEILDNVWDFAFEGDPNIVEVYIRHLRKKLDEPFGRHADRDDPRRGLPARPRRRLTGAPDRDRAGAHHRWRRSWSSASPSPPAVRGWSGAQRAFADPERRDRRPAPVPRHRHDHRRRRLPRRAGRAPGRREPGAGRRRPGPRRRRIGEPRGRGRASARWSPAPSGYAARTRGPDRRRRRSVPGRRRGASSPSKGTLHRLRRRQRSERVDESTDSLGPPPR